MLFLRKVQNLLIIIMLLFFPYSLQADPPIPISNFDVVIRKVRMLREAGVKAEDICVVSDFHGVVVNQKFQEDFMTLKGEIKDHLQYLKGEKVAFVIATAWNKFDQVRKSSVIRYHLNDLLQIDQDATTELQKFKLGKDGEIHLKGYINGKLISLKYDKEDLEDSFFRQKAYGPKIMYEKQTFKYIFYIDDDEGNLAIINKDLEHTNHSKDTQVTLFHLRELPAFYSHKPGEKTPYVNINSSGTNSPVVQAYDDECSSDSEEFNLRLQKRLEGLVKEKVGQERTLMHLNKTNSESSSTSRSGNQSLTTSMDGLEDLKSSQ